MYVWCRVKMHTCGLGVRCPLGLTTRVAGCRMHACMRVSYVKAWVPMTRRVRACKHTRIHGQVCMRAQPCKMEDCATAGGSMKCSTHARRDAPTKAGRHASRSACGGQEERNRSGTTQSCVHACKKLAAHEPSMRAGRSVHEPLMPACVNARSAGAG